MYLIAVNLWYLKQLCHKISKDQEARSSLAKWIELKIFEVSVTQLSARTIFISRFSYGWRLSFHLHSSGYWEEATILCSASITTELLATWLSDMGNGEWENNKTPRMESLVFCNLILEVIYYSLCHTLLVKLTKWNTMWINKSVTIRRWQSLRIILESGYHSEEMVPKQQNLLDHRGKEDAVGSKLDQKWLSIFTPGKMKD